MVEALSKEWTLTSNDRCDAAKCSAQAYVHVIGVTGDIMFCSHHYGSIESNPLANEKIINFAYQIIDERERLNENRLKD
jgi:hypothetical protein